MSADAAVYPWARMMARMQARASIISQITGLSVTDGRRIWHEELGRSSPSGQQPHDSNWFLKTAKRRYHAAWIILAANEASKTMPEYAAFAHAYYHYARVTAGSIPRSIWEQDPAYRGGEKDYEIPFSRAHYLCQIYTDDTFADGRRKCELQISRCKKCGGIYLSHVNEISKKCPLCADKKHGAI